MYCVDFKIYKDGKDTGKLTGVLCIETVSVNLLSNLLTSYPASSGYELVLDKVWDQMEERDGKH